MAGIDSTSEPRPEGSAARDASAWRHAPAVAFALLMGVGTLATLANPSLLRAPEASFWDGAAADAYQRELDATSPLLASSRTVWGVVDLVVFGQGRPGVLVGRDGWLYSAEEYDVVDDVEGAVAAWTTAIADVASRLTDDGVDLVVAVIPAKAAMVPGPAPAPLPHGARARYDMALRALAARGVVAPDLRPVLASAAAVESVYLRTDTHWTPHGAEAVAGAIARTVDEATSFAVDAGGAFATEVIGSEPLLGDLTVYLDLGPLAGRIGPTPDTLEVRRTVDRDGPGDDLFAEVRLPVALVGTSYSADGRWNLAGALRAALGVDVHEAALSGLGPMEPLRRYLDSEAFATTPPEVIVWEIPERYLTLDGYVPRDEP